MDAAAVLLAGGKSSRFGRDKTRLEVRGEPIVARIAGRCRPLCREIFIVSNARDKFGLPGVRELSDLYRDAGPLGGIHAGLSAAGAELVLVVACDMPFFDGGLAAALLEGAAGYDVLVPRIGERLEPLCAVYRRSVLPEVEALLRRGRRSVRGLFPLVRTGYLDCGGPGLDAALPFYNINRPEDYAALEKGAVC